MRAERLADRRGMHVKRVLQDNRARPDPIHQRLLGDQVSGGLGQKPRDFEGTTPKRHRGPENPQFAPGEINLAVAWSVVLSSIPGRHHDSS